MTGSVLAVAEHAGDAAEPVALAAVPLLVVVVLVVVTVMLVVPGLVAIVMPVMPAVAVVARTAALDDAVQGAAFQPQAPALRAVVDLPRARSDIKRVVPSFGHLMLIADPLPT